MKTIGPPVRAVPVQIGNGRRFLLLHLSAIEFIPRVIWKPQGCGASALHFVTCRSGDGSSSGACICTRLRAEIDVRLAFSSAWLCTRLCACDVPYPHREVLTPLA